MSVLVIRAQAPAHRAPARARRAKPNIGPRLNLRAALAFAAVVLPVLVLVAVMGLWGALASLVLIPVVAFVIRRQGKAKVWQSELYVAFKVHERKDLTFYKIL